MVLYGNFFLAPTVCQQFPLVPTVVKFEIKSTVKGLDSFASKFENMEIHSS